MIKQREIRTVSAEMRIMDADGAPVKIMGHAALFDTLSEDLGGFREKIKRSAFTQAILTDDVRALFNHDPNMVLGRNRAGTLHLTEDERGLAFVIDPPDTSFARDLVISLRRGDVSQMSFGFQTVTDTWDMMDGETIRTLIEVRLFDVSPVTYPAYPQTEAALRSLEEFRNLSAANAQTDKGYLARMKMLTLQASV